MKISSLCAYFVVALLFASPYSYANLPKSAQFAKDASNAYGYLIGQSFTLERIESQYPEMAGQVIIAKASFNAAFPSVQSRIREMLLDVYGKEMFEDLELKLVDAVEENLASIPMTRSLAEQFINTVRNRADGVIESPALEIILATTYLEKPAEEVRDGFYQAFESENHPKAQGVELGLRLPVSWVAEDGRRPNIVQKWRNFGGHGPTTIMLDVRDVGADISDTEIRDIVESGEIRSFLPEGATLQDAGLTQLDAQTAYVVDYLYRQDIGETVVMMQVRHYQLYFNGKGVGVMCMSAAGVGDGAQSQSSIKAAHALILAESEKQSGVCRQVAHSLVLYQAW
ncbi:hypothetical protein HHSLTHF2_18010 [Vreelandella venusta]|uniref:Uncharacterized protein n=1 Tax=Halomonas hydrothermalis TaxID=115561 RepID=A0A6F8U430_9GAMM|nr:hypothetical protein [Halomonas hydrothermalis]BCB07911.1 hypothetical protein HHSLTHF2_18010 [Halomonas hydrothermalis]